MKRTVMALALAATMLMTMACGILNSLVGGGTTGGVATLWTDVPPLPGANKADLQLPLPAKLVVQGAFQGQLEFISYTTTQTPQQVEDFYSPDRMQGSGWDSKSGTCTGASGSTGPVTGAFCLFGKQNGDQEVGLAIIIGTDTNTKQTQIYYVRVNISVTPTPKPTG